MATARLDMRLDAEVKSKAKKASALLGHKDLTEYIVKLIDENSSQVIDQHENITLKNNIFDKFLTACDKANVPNKALLAAVRFTKKGL